MKSGALCKECRHQIGCPTFLSILVVVTHALGPGVGFFLVLITFLGAIGSVGSEKLGDDHCVRGIFFKISLSKSSNIDVDYVTLGYQ